MCIKAEDGEGGSKKIGEHLLSKMGATQTIGALPGFCIYSDFRVLYQLQCGNHEMEMASDPLVLLKVETENSRNNHYSLAPTCRVTFS